MKEWKKSRWLMPLLLILVGILLEIFVFNFRHWEAYLWKDEHRNFEEQILGEGLEQVNDSLYRVTAENGEETSCIFRLICVWKIRFHRKTGLSVFR